ncbi:MAG TPA: glycosyltransferase family 39 protein [Vicinamibacterales bacterium]
MNTPAAAVRATWPLIAILAAAFALRVWGAGFGLPHTECRPDERQLVNLATRVADGDLNPHYFIWPTLYVYVLAAVFRLEGLAGLFHDAPARLAELIFTARLLGVLLGTALVYAVHEVSRIVSGRAAARTAAFLCAVTFLAVRESHFGMLDVPMTLAIVAAMTVLLGARVLTPWRAAAFGLAAGLAASIKFNGILVMVPGLVLALYDGARSKDLARTSWRLALGMALAAILGFLAGTPYAALDAPAFLAGTRALHDHLASGHVHDGQQLAIGSPLRAYAFDLLPAAVGWPVVIVAAAGFVLLLVRQRREAVALVSFPVAYLAAASTGSTVFARYALPLVPFICVAAAEAIASLAGRAGHYKVAVVVALSALLAFPSMRAAFWLDTLLARTDSRLLAAQWIAAHVPSGATIAQTGSVYGKVQWSGSNWRETSLDATPQSLPDFVIVPRSPLRLYSRVPESVDALINGDYRLVQDISTGIDAVAPEAFDQSDAFFLPLQRSPAIRRPGPDVSIYERRAR